MTDTSTPPDRARIKADAERVLAQIFRDAPEHYAKLDPSLEPPGLDVVMASARLGHEAKFYPLANDAGRLMVMGGEAWVITDHDYVNNVYDVYMEVEMEKANARPVEGTCMRDHTERPRLLPKLADRGRRASR